MLCRRVACLRYYVCIGHGVVGYVTAAETVFAAQEWIASQDWSNAEEPSPVQVALKWLRDENNK